MSDKLLKDHLHLYYIEWIDSRGTHESWTELKDMASEYCILSSVGWAIKEDDELIHLVPHIGSDPEQGCGDMVIPKISIRHIKKLDCRTIKAPHLRVLHDKKHSKKSKTKRGECLSVKSKVEN